eukprot:TRINITY_DN4258_c0_g1_i2.p1 TRINITY_DN4258_c0_g1~~TRINITY_DN4258_c0_g1_i2.p1  ORF type:complete len:194 (+),score=15.76 TRINITY_DN4258_c0_g1_i2:64-645(+)
MKSISSIDIQTVRLGVGVVFFLLFLALPQSTYFKPLDLWTQDEVLEWLQVRKVTDKDLQLVKEKNLDGPSLLLTSPKDLESSGLPLSIALELSKLVDESHRHQPSRLWWMLIVGGIALCAAGALIIKAGDMFRIDRYPNIVGAASLMVGAGLVISGTFVYFTSFRIWFLVMAVVCAYRPLWSKLNKSQGQNGR